MNRKLTTAQQIFIVQQLACKMRPSEVVESVKEEFKVNVTRQLVWTYHPENNPKLSAPLKDFFEKTHKAFADESGSLRIQKRKYRLKKLDSLIVQAERGRIYGLAAQLLEQAAKECGGYYERGKADKPLSAAGSGVVNLKDWKR
jgi:hypothetical protein